MNNDLASLFAGGFALFFLFLSIAIICGDNRSGRSFG